MEITTSRYGEPGGGLMPGASARSRSAAVVCLMLLAGGCASQGMGAAGAGHRPAAPAASGLAGGSGIRDLATDYLTIAVPANRQLDQEVDAYDDHARGSLAAAESALRAETAAERRFDKLLSRIGFPPGIEATDRALVAVNQHRITLTELQAQSTSTAGLLRGGQENGDLSCWHQCAGAGSAGRLFKWSHGS